MWMMRLPLAASRGQQPRPMFAGMQRAGSMRAVQSAGWRLATLRAVGLPVVVQWSMGAPLFLDSNVSGIYGITMFHTFVF